MSETLSAPRSIYENTIPPAVLAAGRRANDLHAQLMSSAADLQLADNPPAEPPAAAPAAAPENQPEPQTPPAAAAPLAAEDQTWEQRYRTLDGKYKSETAELRSRLDRATGQIDTLNHIVAEMRSSPVQPPADTTVGAPPPARAADVSPEDLEQFGPDLVEAARRWARAEYQPDIERLEARIERLTGGQQKIEAQSTADKVQRQLDADPELTSRWRDLNSNPQFMSWLQETDAFSGRKRQDMLTEAYNRGDSQRTATFFKAFLNEHTATRAPAQAPAHTPDAGADRPTLESFATPGRGASTPAGTGGAGDTKRIWTRTDITKFYRDRMNGAYAGKEQQAAALEADIIAATGEGRVR